MQKYPGRVGVVGRGRRPSFTHPGRFVSTMRILGGARRSYANYDGVCSRHLGLQIPAGSEVAAFHIRSDEFREPELDDRALARVELLNLDSVDIDRLDVVAAVRETRRSDGPNVTESYDTDLHPTYLSRSIGSLLATSTRVDRAPTSASPRNVSRDDRVDDTRSAPHGNVH